MQMEQVIEEMRHDNATAIKAMHETGKLVEVLTAEMLRLREENLQLRGDVELAEARGYTNGWRDGAADSA